MADLAESFNFSWIDDMVCGFGFPHTGEQITYLAGQGVDIVVSLSTKPMNMKKAREQGMDVIHLPIRDMGIPSKRLAKKFFEIVDTAASNSKKVGVHCLFGQGRTGLMLSLYLIKYKGMQQVDALKWLREQRPKSVESLAQHRFVLDFVP